MRRRCRGSAGGCHREREAGAERNINAEPERHAESQPCRNRVDGHQIGRWRPDESIPGALVAFRDAGLSGKMHRQV